MSLRLPTFPRRMTCSLFLAVAALPGATAWADISGFGGNGTGFTLNSYLSTPTTGTAPSVAGNVATLTTDNLHNQHSAASLFDNTAQNIDAFQAAFTYQVTSANSTKEADGVTFTLENDARKAAALGGQGSSLGYGTPSSNTTPSTAAITHSAGISLDVFATPGTLLTGFESGGAASYTNNANTVKIGDVVHVTLAYNNGTLTETVANTTRNTTATFSEQVDLPALVGTVANPVDTAYVGFTAGTGGSYSTQQISGFTYTVLSQPSGVPEPSTWAMLAGACGWLLWFVIRRRGRDTGIGL